MKTQKAGGEVQASIGHRNEKRYRFKEDGISIAFLLALVALYFLPVLTEGNGRVLSIVGTDIWNQYFYWRHFGFDSLARGEIPLWNAYIFSGTPYIAGIQSAIFYPLNIIYLFFGTPFAINLSIALHCFLASLFTYLFARYMDLGRAGSVLSAVTFAYGAPYFFHIYPGHLSNLSTMAWLPLLFMGVEAFLRHKKIKYAVLSGIPLSLQVFAGHPQYLFYSAIAVSLYFLLRMLVSKDKGDYPYFLTGFCLFVLTGLSLSAIQLIPTLELTRYSSREALDYEWVSVFSFPPENLITLLVPDFFGDFSSVPYWGKNYLWEASVYIGIVPLAMAAAAVLLHRSRSIWIFSAILVSSILLALGKHTPLLRLLYEYVPGFNLFRGLSKFVFVGSFALSILAGYGVEIVILLAKARSTRLRYFAYSLLGFAFLFLVGGALGVFYGQELWRLWVETYVKGEDRYLPLPPLTGEFFHASIRMASQGMFRMVLISAVLGGSLLIFLKAKKLSVNSLIVSVLALTALDLWGFGYHYLVTFDPQRLRMDRDLKAFLAKDDEPFRLAVPRLPDVNMGMLEDIENVGGYDAIVLKSYSELINAALGFPIDRPNMIMGISSVSPIFDLLNVKYYVLDSGSIMEQPGLSLVFQSERYQVYRNGKALPRSFIVHDAWVIKGREAILRAMASPSFDPTSAAVIEEAIEGLPNNPALRSPVPKVMKPMPTKVLIDADLKAPGLLVLGDVYYPGWKAFVDGRESKIYRVNHVMRGVFLREGRHVVEFRYEPLSFKIGILISAAGFVLVVGFLSWLKIRG